MFELFKLYEYCELFDEVICFDDFEVIFCDFLRMFADELLGMWFEGKKFRRIAEAYNDLKK